MKYFYTNAALPKHVSLLFQINLAAERLHKKLIHLDMRNLGISEYNQRYLGGKLDNFIGSLQCYSYIMALSLYDHTIPLHDLTFVAYGDGSGVLSLLAKELGIGRVIYNDIYDVSCNDAKKIARATGTDVDDYICGGIDELISYIENNSLYINAIASHDVIEHIYDVEGYLRKLHSLFNNQHLRGVFTSEANPKNPIISRRMRSHHLKCEQEDRERKWGYKECDTIKSFLRIRRGIIDAYLPGLSQEVKEELARKTRGLMKHDIERCLDEYRIRGSIRYRPTHPTNTCDPYTGNWQEQLLEPEWFERILSDEGFSVRILSGYWQHSECAQKRFIKNMLNIVIKYLGRNGLILAPYYVVFADYNGRS